MGFLQPAIFEPSVSFLAYPSSKDPPLAIPSYGSVLERYQQIIVSFHWCWRYDSSGVDAYRAKEIISSGISNQRYDGDISSIRYGGR